MRKTFRLAVAVVLVVIAACTPEAESVAGVQHLTLGTTGRHQWSVDYDLAAPSYHVGLADDGGLARVTGEALVNSSSGEQLRVTIDVSRLDSTLHGTIAISDTTAGGDLIGIVDQPAMRVAQTGDTTTVELTAQGGNIYRGAVVPANISLTLRVRTDQTSDHDLIVGIPTPIGSLASGESRSWTLPVTGPRSFGLSVGGGASGECPDLEVLDATGAFIGGLGGCGSTAFRLETAGTYVVRETAGPSGDAGDSSILVTDPKDAGRLALDTTVGAPELEPGQYAVWRFSGNAGDRVGVAAWSPGSATSVVLIDPDGAEVATSGATGGGRTAFAPLPMSGDYSVQVTNTSSAAATAGAISVRASSPIAGGAFSDSSAFSPELLPGASVVWTRPGTATSVLSLEVNAATGRCLLLRITAPGNPLPTESQGCGRVTTTRVAVTDGNWVIELTNLDSTTSPVGAFVTTVTPPIIAAPLAVGSSETLDGFGPGATVQIPVAGGTGQQVTFRIDGVDGECYSALVRLNGAPTGAGSGLCDQSLGTAEVETVVPTLGDFTLEVSSNGLVSSAGPVSVTALQLHDVDAGELILGSPSLSPALSAGDRAVWSYSLPGAIDQFDFQLELTAGATGCSYVDTITAGEPPSPLARLCPGDAVSLSRAVQDQVLLRASVDNPLGGGALSVTTSKSSDGPPAVRGGAAALLVPSEHTSYVDAQNTKPGTRTAANATASLSDPNSTNANQPCKDVLFVGLRGSGQETGYGPQVWSAYQKMAATVAGRLSIANISIELPDYDAHKVPFPASITLTSWHSFLDGINKGADALYSILQTRRHCGETIVLGGYSQGAMAVHRTLIDLATNQDTETLSRVAGAILIADGDRRKGDAMSTYGSAGRLLQGIAPTYGVGGARPVRFGSGWESTIRSVCNARDAVCDQFSLAYAPGFTTHTKYTNTQPLWDAAGAAAQRAIYLHGLTSGSWPGPSEPVSSCLITTTLTWSGPGDVDLHVLEPSGRHVYYNAKQGAAGYLDVDNTTGYGPEHYYASCNSDSALGDFVIGVTNYGAPTSTPIQIRVASPSFSSGPISIDIGPSTGSSSMTFPLFRLRVSRGANGAIQVQQLPA